MYYKRNFEKVRAKLGAATLIDWGRYSNTESQQKTNSITPPPPISSSTCPRVTRTKEQQQT